MGANLAQLLAGLIGPQSQGPVQTQQPGNVPVQPQQQQQQQQFGAGLPGGGLLGAAPQVQVPQQQFNSKSQLRALATLLAINPQAGAAALGLKQQNTQNIQQAQRTNVGLQQTQDIARARNQRIQDTEDARRTDARDSEERQERVDRLDRVRTRVFGDADRGLTPDPQDPGLALLTPEERQSVLRSAAGRASAFNQKSEKDASVSERNFSRDTTGLLIEDITGIFDDVLVQEAIAAADSVGGSEADRGSAAQTILEQQVDRIENALRDAIDTRSILPKDAKIIQRRIATARKRIKSRIDQGLRKSKLKQNKEQQPFITGPGRASAGFTQDPNLAPGTRSVLDFLTRTIFDPKEVELIDGTFRKRPGEHFK